MVELPAQVSNSVVLNPAGRYVELEGLKTLAAAHNMPPPEEGVSCYYQSADIFGLRWERHNEFST